MTLPRILACSFLVTVAFGGSSLPAQEPSSDEWIERPYFAPHPSFPNPLLDEVVTDPKIIFAQNGIQLDEAQVRFEESGAMVVNTDAYRHRLIRALFAWKREQARMKQVADIRAIDATEELLKKTVLPEVSFTQTPFEKALTQLRQDASQHFDNAVELVPFDIFQSPGYDREEIAAREVNLALSDVTLETALKHTCWDAKMTYHVHPDEISISILLPIGGQHTRVHILPRYLLPLFEGNGDRMETLLMKLGIENPEGSSIAVTESTGMLIIRNIQEHHDRLDAFLISTHEDWARLREAPLSREPLEILQETMIPRIRFTDLPLGAALAFLEEYGLGREEKKEPTKNAPFGDSLYLTSDWKSSRTGQKRISLRAKDISLFDAISEICRLGGCEFEVKENGVIVREKE